MQQSVSSPLHYSTVRRFLHSCTYEFSSRTRPPGKHPLHAPAHSRSRTREAALEVRDTGPAFQLGKSRLGSSSFCQSSFLLSPTTSRPLKHIQILLPRLLTPATKLPRLLTPLDSRRSRFTILVPPPLIARNGYIATLSSSHPGTAGTIVVERGTSTPISTFTACPARSTLFCIIVFVLVHSPLPQPSPTAPAILIAHR